MTMRTIAMTLLLASLTGCGSAGTAGSAPTLHDLKDIADLQTRFDADADSVRLVLLMSPT